MTKIITCSELRYRTVGELQALVRALQTVRIPRHRERRFQTIVSAQSTRS
jgi:hypothetical protein